MTEKPVFIYLIAHVEAGKLAGPVKVGITANLPSRLASLRTGNPRPIDIAAACVLPNRDLAVDVESAFHTVMSKHRLEGEWFNLSPHEALTAFCKNLYCALKYYLSDDPSLFESAKTYTGLTEVMALLGEIDELALQNGTGAVH